MKLSVIIPVYNGEKWVAQCIENILGQSYKDLEVIVVDDWVNLHFYERMAEAAALTGADMAFGGMIHEATTGLTRSFSQGWLASVTEDKFSLTDVGTNGCAVRYIIRRSLLDDNGLRFEVGRSYSEDILFSVQAVNLANKVVTVPEAVYYYKKRPGSAMKSRDPELKRRRKEGLASGNTAKRELMQSYALPEETKGVHVVHKFQYKIFGIPVAAKKIFNNNITCWYMFGVRVMQRKRKL